MDDGSAALNGGRLGEQVDQGFHRPAFTSDHMPAIRRVHVDREHGGAGTPLGLDLYLLRVPNDGSDYLKQQVTFVKHTFRVINVIVVHDLRVLLGLA